MDGMDARRDEIDRTVSLSYERLADVALWRDLQVQAGLSDREVQVAILLLRSFTYGQISDAIGIGKATVRTYCLRLYRKLDVNGRTGLVLKLVLASGVLLLERPGRNSA
jgi:DNA-binding CsgD family transcriptional regulator